MRSLAVMVVVLAAGSGCCGYGGPGCGDPALVGLCQAQVPVGESTAMLAFFDDTGHHASRFGSVWTSPANALTAIGDAETGEVILEGREPGHATLFVDGVEGWDAAVEFQFSLVVVEEVAAGACDEETGTILLPEPR